MTKVLHRIVIAAVMAILLAQVLSVGVTAAAVGLPKWLTVQYDSRNSGLSPYRGPATSDTTWMVAGYNGFPVIGSDGTFYTWSEGNLMAFDSSGAIVWTYHTGGNEYGYDSTTPTIAADDNIHRSHASSSG